MGPTACGLVAGLIDSIEGWCSDQGRPRCPTERVVETLRFFLREGVQWRELRATGDRVCGATLRRRITEWSAAALLRRVHAALVRMVRSFAWCARGRERRRQRGMLSLIAAVCAPSAAAS
jgi:transposase